MFSLSFRLSKDGSEPGASPPSPCPVDENHRPWILLDAPHRIENFLLFGQRRVLTANLLITSSVVASEVSANLVLDEIIVSDSSYMFALLIIDNSSSPPSLPFPWKSTWAPIFIVIVRKRIFNSIPMWQRIIFSELVFFASLGTIWTWPRQNRTVQRMKSKMRSSVFE